MIGNKMTVITSTGLLLAALCVLTQLNGCSPGRGDSGAQILRLGNGTEPQDIDPHIVTGVSEHNIISALLEGLVSEDPRDLSPRPGVAERWDVDSTGLRYRFYLREDARWSNGDTVTAGDFVFSFKRILTPALGSEYAYMLHCLENARDYHAGIIDNFDLVGARAVEPRVLEITLAHPTPYFLSLLNHYSWFPVHPPTIRAHNAESSRASKWTRPGNFVGNGPFVLERWDVNEIIVVKKNPHYWDRDTVRLDEIHFYPIDNDLTEERSFAAGRLHVTHGLPIHKIDTYRQKQPHFLRIDPYLGVYFYRLNTTRKPLDDPRVRRALNLAINREDITALTNGGQTPAYHFTPPNTAGYTSAHTIAGTVDDARRLLAEAGYPDGSGFPKLDILYNTSENHQLIAQAIQEMWKKNLGIEVGLLNQEWKVYLDNQQQMNYDMARAGWIGDYNDPNTFLDMWLTGGGNNQTGWGNAAYDSLVALASHENDGSVRMSYFQEAEKILLDELPVLPIYFYVRTTLVRPEVKGWFPTILDHHPYKYVHLESDE